MPRLGTGVAFAAAALFGLAGCAGNEFSASVQDGYTRNCLHEGNSTSFCECVLDGLQENFSEAEFVAIDNATASPSGNVAQEDVDTILGIADGCRDE